MIKAAMMFLMILSMFGCKEFIEVKECPIKDNNICKVVWESSDKSPCPGRENEGRIRGFNCADGRRYRESTTYSPFDDECMVFYRDIREGGER